MKNFLGTAIGLYGKVQTIFKYGMAVADTLKYAIDRFTEIEKTTDNGAD